MVTHCILSEDFYGFKAMDFGLCLIIFSLAAPVSTKCQTWEVGKDHRLGG